MNGTCPEQDKLLLFVEGQLRPEEADGVAKHVAGCSHCEEKAAELRLLTERLRMAASGTAGVTARGMQAAPEVEAGPQCPEPEALAAYADGSVQGDAAAAIERHVAGCRACLTEVADVWALAGPPDHDASGAAVARALRRLQDASRTAVVRWRERSLELVRGFAWSLAGEPGGAMAPAMAVARSGSDEVRLEWSSGETKLVGLVRNEGTVSLTGRVTVGEAPAAAASVALSSEAGLRGPESPDGDGRFGPWPLSGGRNVLRLSGVEAEAGGAVDLVIEVEADEAVEE